jgi:hypothetical protein
VASAQTEPAAVTQQIADAHLARDVGVAERELRQAVHHAVVPGKLAFVHQHGQRRGGEGLGVGGNAEQRVPRHRIGFPGLAHAIALAEHHLAVFDHRYGHARNVEFLARVFHGF